MLNAGRGFWVFVAACVALIGVLLVHSYLTYQTLSRVAAPPSTRAMPTDSLTDVSSGFVVATDAAPPPALDDPRFVDAAEASEFVAPEDEVYLVESPDGPIVFPRALMRDYEVVNFTIQGRRATMTYCANTDSAVGFWDTFAGITTS
jgi:hypothetical protein